VAPLLLFAALSAVLDSTPAVSGNCNPTRVHFTGHIKSDEPVKVTYTWVRLNHPAGRTYTLDFRQPGALPVSFDLLIRKKEEGTVMLRVIFPQHLDSAKVKYKIRCD
jgi:hypothetical protein